MTRMLSSFTVANTRDTEMMSHVLTDIYDARSFDTAAPGLFHAEASYFDLGSSSLSFCSYGAPTRVGFRDDHYLRLQIAVEGAGATVAGGRTAEVAPGTLVCSPADAEIQFGQAFRQLVLRVNIPALEHDLYTLLGRRPDQPLSFNMTETLASPQARRVNDLIFHTVNSIDAFAEPIPAPVLRELDHGIRVALLYGIPNIYSRLLYAEQKMSAPWQVKRVEEWIDAHWREDVTIQKLADVSGVSARSIFASFKRSRGYSPMTYLKTVRLQNAHEMLLKGGRRASVTAIAYACRFSGLGHFSRYYREQFGELPSETLNRQKAQS